MTGRPTYLPGALGRIEGLGEKAINTFFNEIPRESLIVITGLLPPLAGFRPGTTATVRRQLQSLAKKIAAHRTTKRFPRSREETVLYELWCAWSQSQLADTVVVRELLERLEEEDDEECEAADNHGRMATALQALATSRICARETLEQFVIFSPFENIDDLLTLARSAPTSAEIKRDSTLLDLPDRLHKDEARLQLIESKLDASDQNTASIRSELGKLRRTVADVQTTVAQDRTLATDLKRATAAVAKSQKSLEDIITRAVRAVDDLSKRVAESKKLSDQITEDVRTNAAGLKGLGERLTGFDQILERVDHLEKKLEELIDKKSSDEAVMKDGMADTVSERAAPQIVESSVLVERLRLESWLSVKPVNSIAEILSSLDSALGEAGLRKSMASALAEEILAAIATEQVVFFRGGLAVDVARKCALSLCGTCVFRVAIPLGLADPALLRQQLNDRPLSGSVSSVVVEGVNNSPLDLLRDVLLDQVTYRVGSLGRNAPTMVFASLSDGAGAFPLEPSYLELGPVFDLEQMDWRRLRREELPVLGSVVRDAWQSITATWEGKTFDYEEPLRGVRRLAHRRNARIEANVVRAFCSLKTLRREQGGLTALQSVTFGWLAPYWLALAAKPDDIDFEIDGGKCDGTIVDDRLKRLLAEYRGQRPGDPE